jgi:hypothetical protein
MDPRRLFNIAVRLAAGLAPVSPTQEPAFDAVNKELAQAHNADHARSILGQHKVKLFKEPAYPKDIPETKDDLDVGIESINDCPLGGLHFLRKAEHGWEIGGPPK